MTVGVENVNNVVSMDNIDRNQRQAIRASGNPGSVLVSDEGRMYIRISEDYYVNCNTSHILCGGELPSIAKVYDICKWDLNTIDTLKQLEDKLKDSELGVVWEKSYTIFECLKMPGCIGVRRVEFGNMAFYEMSEIVKFVKTAEYSEKLSDDNWIPVFEVTEIEC